MVKSPVWLEHKVLQTAEREAEDILDEIKLSSLYVTGNPRKLNKEVLYSDLCFKKETKTIDCF